MLGQIYPGLRVWSFFKCDYCDCEGRCRRADDDAHGKDLQIEDMRQQVFDEMIKASLTFVKTSCSEPFLFNSTHVAT